MPKAWIYDSIYDNICNHTWHMITRLHSQIRLVTLTKMDTTISRWWDFPKNKERFGDKFVWNILSKVPIDVISRQIHRWTFILKDFEEKSWPTITTCWCDHIRHSQSDESDSIIGVGHKCPFQLCKYGDQWHWRGFIPSPP